MNYKTLLTMKVDKTDLTEVEKNFVELMKRAIPQVQEGVIKEVFNDIQNSGNVPVDTGKLKSAGMVMPDKFDRNYWIMGWQMPYAKVNYYGLKATKEFATVEGKRQRFFTQRHGTPFWDRPFTKNAHYMVKIYEKHLTGNKEIN